MLVYLGCVLHSCICHYCYVQVLGLVTIGDDNHAGPPTVWIMAWAMLT